MTVVMFALASCFHQDSDDEGNDDNDEEEKPSAKKEFMVRSPSPPAEDSEPEMTEEEKEFQLVRTVCSLRSFTLRLCRGLSENDGLLCPLPSDDYHKDPSDRDPSRGH